ncbi:MAG: aminoglycoside phosphotransferase family protein [Acidimicrobiales bacterium]|nr:aminoglycoside phosphotransferase family protein [Acidimicrobiales bacterium]
MITVPEIVQEKARVEGVAWWIDAAPRVVEDLAAAWQLEVGPVLTGGTESLVAEVVLSDGRDAVLKVLIPRQDFASAEALALQRADGRGAARLFAYDEEHGALLLERLGPPLDRAGLPAAARHEILARAAQAFWRPIEPGLLRDGTEQATWLADCIERMWVDLGRPCSRAAIDHALSCAERRAAAHDDERAVLVHGDVHQWNTLRRGDEWVLIDPDGLFMAPAYDLGIIMREDPEEQLSGDPRDRSRRLAALTGVDETAVWEWGVVERVATGLTARSIDLEPVATTMLAVADRLAARR